MNPKKVFIVSHTHWDREWYQSFYRFRVNLLGIVDEVLDLLSDDDVYTHYVLDGQAIVLEDYLEACPEDATRVSQFVAEGKLSLGPWYILPDEFLVSAESTVRNLLIGHKIANSFGGVQKVGYIPDSFGHIAQMPQILRKAGIDSFIYTRGNGPEIDELGYEYSWAAPDGSEVLAINQCGGYCNAGGLGYEELWHANTARLFDADLAVKQVGELFSKMEPLSNGDIYLLNDGCDHFKPKRELRLMLEKLRKAFPETEFIHSGFAEYIEAVKSAGFATKRHQGELIRGKLHPILNGVWSARMNLKQQNDRAQTLLSNYLEPLSAHFDFDHYEPYPHGLIESAWKLLMKNHPHDSICGCSIDEVHREMETRFLGVIQTAEQAIRNTLTILAPTFGGRAEDDEKTAIAVANPLPMRRTEVVERMVVLQPFGIDPESLRLYDGSGREVPFAILRIEYVERIWGIDYRTELFYEDQKNHFETYRSEFGRRISKGPEGKDTHDCFLTIQFHATDLPALSHAIYYLKPAPAGQSLPAISGPVRVSGSEIDNEYYHLRLYENGTFDLFDKSTGDAFKGLNRLEDTGDIGDEYDYSSAPVTKTITSDGCPGRVSVLEDTGLSGRLEAAFTMKLPVSIEEDRSLRSETLVDCRAVTRVCLKRGSKVIEIEQSFENLAKDHRLRVEFPTPIATETIISDGHFYINHRPIKQPTGEGWVQPPPGPYPQQEYSLLQDGMTGLAVLNKGLPEVEATRDSDGKAMLSLTLLRSVGWLSRDDFAARKLTGAGPMISTPDAQCQGMQRFEYAIVTFEGDHLEADIKSMSQRYRTPVPSVQGVGEQRSAMESDFLTKVTKSTCITAIRKHEERQTMLVRLYNLTDQPVEEKLVASMNAWKVWKTDLLDERKAELQHDGSKEVTLHLGPHEIVSAELEFGLAPESPAST